MKLHPLVVWALFAVRAAMGENGGSLLEQHEQDPVSLEKKSSNEAPISKWVKGAGHDDHQVAGMVKPEWVKPIDDRPASGRTSSVSDTNKRGLRVHKDPQEGPQQKTSRHRNLLLWKCGTAGRRCCWFHREKCDTGLTCIKPSLFVKSTCEKSCTSLDTDDRVGLLSAIQETGEGGTLTLCAPTNVTWTMGDGPLANLGDPDAPPDVPLNFTLECDNAGEEDSKACVLFGGGTSNFFQNIDPDTFETPDEPTNWTFRRMTFQKGFATFGGAINFGDGKTLDAALTLEGCHFLHNTADVFGGAAFILGGRLEATNCGFVGNEADAFGGGVFLDSSTGDFSGGGNTFDGNSARFDIGGALFVNDDSTVTLCTASPALENKFVDNVGNSILQDYCISRNSNINVPSADNCDECVEIKDIVDDVGDNVCDVVPCQSR